MSPKNVQKIAVPLTGAPDANALQNRASDPTNSVWVGASAGTGKTKVLTDRVLRLLLPQIDGRAGTAPHKILCLTFTKAGAGEMALRLSKKLTQWAVMPEEKLKQELFALMGRKPNDEEANAARALFTRVIDTPGGLKIMTIHSFCQSVLGRFPLEAGLSSNFHVLEQSTASEYLEQARLQVLRTSKTQATSPLASALNRIARTINEEQFFALLSNIISERGQLQKILKHHFGPEGLYEFLCKTYKIEKTEEPESLRIPAFQDNLFDKDALVFAAQTMIGIGTKSDQKNGIALLSWLETSPERRTKNYAAYKNVFFTQEGTVRAKLANKDVANAHPEILITLAREAERLQTLDEIIKAAHMALLTRDLFTLCSAILEEYQRLKQRAGGLDFDDLILKTLDLLMGKSMNLDAQSSALWVQHKLDEGLEHILIDEAQDTNPEQWEIIKALCDDFFTGQGASDTERTVFTVGDEKQSIYSFQRASPKAFHRMRDYFAEKVTQSGKLWDPVPMQKSFRSAESILRLVDHVFAHDEFKKGLGNAAIEHFAHREGQEGIAELWPVFPTDKTEEVNLWNYTYEQSDENEAGSVKLARHVARTIDQWLKSGERLPSHDRPIRPGDILILVRTRSKIVRQISRALKDLKIPVSGLDRIILNEQLVILDLLACGEFVLQPRDDLTLACLLKSPLIGMSEETLFDLCVDRSNKNLWDILKLKSPAIAAYLSALLSLSHSAGPFALFSHILQSPCPADTGSGRKAFYTRLGIDAMDALDVFLSGALDFERSEAPSLQKFLQAQKHSRNEIKREQESGMDVVRIMTVHGSKGLQAPIVILPDTASTFKSGAPRPDKRLLWPTQTDLPVPIWSPAKDIDGALFKEAMETFKVTLEEEYRRLFYVALTRAEDRIYIAAATAKNRINLPEHCWYKMAEAGFKSARETEKLENGTLRISNPQNKEPDRLPKAGAAETPKAAPPPWLATMPETELSNRAVMRPSFIHEKAASPLDEQSSSRFLRGNLTHKLLQYLPDIPQERRQSVGVSYLVRYGAELDDKGRSLVLDETLRILNDPDYAELFGAQSMAEVPITGRIEGLGLVSGQIDRIVIGAKEVVIIDYKTNRPPPKTPQDIPQPYREQMALYEAVLRQIYPDKPVRCFLLWTDGCILMPVNTTT
jgi:ATP-dependent helicase/nuclease subunit A